MNLIHGQHVFRVAGFNMVLTDEGAAAYLENDKGTTFPLVIDEVVSKQLFKAHTSELLPGGDYKLVVKSRAGDAGGPLQTSFRKVKYLRVVDPGPTVTKINADNTFQAGGGNIVTGANMRFAGDDPGGALVIKDGDEEVSAMIATDEQVPVTESRFGLSINGDFMADREYTFEFTMIGADNQPVKVTKTATFVE